MKTEAAASNNVAKATILYACSMEEEQCAFSRGSFPFF